MLPVSRRGRPEGIVIEHGREEQGRVRRLEERREPGGGQRSDRKRVVRAGQWKMLGEKDNISLD